LKVFIYTIFFISSLAYADSLIGTWKIKSLEKNRPFNIASGIGYGMTVRFNDNATLTKIDSRTGKEQGTKHTWQVVDGGSTINITLKSPNSSLIAKFVLKSAMNDYLKVISKLPNKCYKMKAYHGNGFSFVSMCKVD